MNLSGPQNNWSPTDRPCSASSHVVVLYSISVLCLPGTRHNIVNGASDGSVCPRHLAATLPPDHACRRIQVHSTYIRAVLNSFQPYPCACKHPFLFSLASGHRNPVAWQQHQLQPPRRRTFLTCARYSREGVGFRTLALYLLAQSGCYLELKKRCTWTCLSIGNRSSSCLSQVHRRRWARGSPSSIMTQMCRLLVAQKMKPLLRTLVYSYTAE